ncbi:MAG: hypothetical protein QXT27_01700 [Pyrobaculum sp.]
MGVRFTTLDKRVSETVFDLERALNRAVIKARALDYAYICNDGTVTHKHEECRGGVLISFIRKKRMLEDDFNHPLVERVKEVMREITDEDPDIFHDKIVYEVYLGDLIPLGETTAYIVDLMAGTIRRGAFHELEEEAERLKNEMIRRVPELSNHYIDHLIFLNENEIFPNEDEIDKDEIERIKNMRDRDRKIVLTTALAFPSKEMLDLLRSVFINKTTS